MPKRLLSFLLVSLLSVGGLAPTARAAATEPVAPQPVAAQAPAAAETQPSAAQAPATPWQWAHPTLPANDLTDVIYAGGQFVAVGGYGTILTSPDGTTWTQQPSGALEHLQTVVYGGGRYVTFAQRGPILVSPNGAAWTRVPLPDGAGEIQDMAYGNGRFVALSQGGWLTSPDGITWHRHERDTAHERPRQITFGAGRFAAAGLRSALQSTDGITWEEQAFEAYNTPTALDYAGGRFLLFGSRAALMSPDGLTWQPMPQPMMRTYGFETPVSVMGMAYGDGHLLVTGAEGSIYSSDDGAAWQNVSPDPATVPGLLLGIKSPLGAAAYGNATFVAVGARGMIYTSADGRTWAPRHQLRPFLLKGVAQGAGRYVAVGTDGTMLTSPDGKRWTELQTGHQENLNGVRFLGDRFIALGDKGLLLVSADGLQWEPANTPSDIHLQDAAFSGTTYVAVGESGSVLYSGDARTWTASPSLGKNVSLSGVTYAAGTFVAVGTSTAGSFANEIRGNRFIATSPDGRTWTARVDEWARPLTAIAYGNGTFVAVDGGGRSLRSATGTDWTVHPANTPYMDYGDGPNRIAFDGQMRMFVGTIANQVRVSGDGVRWVSAPLPADEAMLGLAADAGVYTVVGERGTILTAASDGPGCGTLFADVPAAHPACRAIEGLAARQVIRGDHWGGFRPHDSLSRAEAAALLARAMGWAPAPGGETTFSDVAGHWVLTQGYLQTAVAHQAMKGFPDSTFRPDAPVTRAELLKMTAAALGLEPPPLENPRHWSTGWLVLSRGAGLIGKAAPYQLWPLFELDPDMPATRAEAALLLVNALP